jgi:hypothetical protein
MELASPPRKLLLHEMKSPMELASPPRKEITYGISFSSKKTSPRKEITYVIILRELESR